MAQFLPIPDMPVRDLIIKLYQAPGEVEDLVSRRRGALTGDKPWVALAGDTVPSGPCLDQIRGEDFRTPDFGERTPEFGEHVKYVQELMSTFGSGRVLRTFDAEWPRFPMWSLEEPVSEKVRVGDELKRSYPVEPYPFPACGIERRKDPRGFNYIVRWPDKLRFEGEAGEKESVWFNVNKESYPGEAEEACWEYFQEVQRRYARQGMGGKDAGHPDGFGPCEGKYGEDRWFHGTSGDHVFRVVRRPFGDSTNPGNKLVIRNWNPVEDTALPAEQFCGNCRYLERVGGADHYECLGHELISRLDAVDAMGRPVVPGEEVAAP